MYPEESRAIDDIFLYLSDTTATPPQPPSEILTAVHVEAIIQVLERWPPSQRFPGMFIHQSAFVSWLTVFSVVDLSRLLTGFCPEAFNSPGLRERFFEALFKASEWEVSWELPLSKPRETNILLLFRTLANVFQENISSEGTWIGKVC